MSAAPAAVMWTLPPQRSPWSSDAPSAAAAPRRSSSRSSSSSKRARSCRPGAPPRPRAADGAGAPPRMPATTSPARSAAAAARCSCHGPGRTHRLSRRASAPARGRAAPTHQPVARRAPATPAPATAAPGPARRHPHLPVRPSVPGRGLLLEQVRRGARRRRLQEHVRPSASAARYAGLMQPPLTGNRLATGDPAWPPLPPAGRPAITRRAPADVLQQAAARPLHHVVHVLETVRTAEVRVRHVRPCPASGSKLRSSMISARPGACSASFSHAAFVAGVHDQHVVEPLQVRGQHLPRGVLQPARAAAPRPPSASSGGSPVWYDDVPAESMSKRSARPARSTTSRNTPSASGERQMLPRQTNSTPILSLIRSVAAALPMHSFLPMNSRRPRRSPRHRCRHAAAGDGPDAGCNAGSAADEPCTDAARVATLPAQLRRGQRHHLLPPFRRRALGPQRLRGLARPVRHSLRRLAARGD
jgi:hypothetical protein